MFDSPWPMNSWLPSMRCPDLSAIERAIDTASASASPVIAKAILANSRIVSNEKCGIESGGNAPGRAPIVSMPVRPAPKAWLRINATRLPASMATIM